MPTRREIEKAIVVLEANRNQVGDDFVGYTLAALHKALSSGETRPQSKQQKPMTVLVTDLHGFTAMSDRMDAEMVRDTINALWARLDSVIEAWGGRVDRHTGDGLIALFGAVAGYEEDEERAIQAALEMQMALGLFNETAVTPSGKSLDLQMRIAIHCGPVYFEQVGMSDDFTAVGDTVDAAVQLQRLAPEGQVLISYDVYWRVHDRYQVALAEPARLSGKGGVIHVYVVKKQNPRTFRTVYQGFESGPRLVGRNDALEQVQEALELTIDRSQAMFVNVVGDAGIGKTRLLYDLAVMVDLLPVQVSELMGQAHPGTSQTPYALARDILSNYLGVHAQYSLDAARGYLVRGLAEMIAQVDSSGAGNKAKAMAQFMGVMLPPSNGQQAVTIPNEVRNLAFQGTADFVRAIAGQHLAVIIFLEDLHLADEGSLDVVEYILQNCQDLPMLVVGLARPSLFEKRPSWRSLDTLGGFEYQQINLEPLSPIDSRHLVMETLGNSGKVPVKLTDLIVEKAGGNPLYIEQLIKMLVDDGVLIREGDEWRSEPGRLPQTGEHPSLTKLLTARFNHMSPDQQLVIRYAAVFGRIFWQTAVSYLADADEDPEKHARLHQAFDQLLAGGFIIKRAASTMAGTSEFAFQHRQLREMAYGSIPVSERRIYHAQAAAWLIVHSNQSPEHASYIARQFELAEDIYQAADWYGRAGELAYSRQSVETAVELYQKALAFLPAQESTRTRRMNLNRQLGAMLDQLARFDQAVHAYSAMRDAAQAENNQEAVLDALLAMAAISYRQGNPTQMLAISQQAEALANQLKQPAYDTAVKIAAGWARLALGDTDAALELAKEALNLSTENDIQLQIAHSNALIGNICRLMNWNDQGVSTSKQALALFRESGDKVWRSFMWVNLGRLAQMRQKFSMASKYFNKALSLASDAGDIYSGMLSLRAQVALAQQVGDYKRADQTAERINTLAERSQNPRLLILSALLLGNLSVNRIKVANTQLIEEERDQYLNTAHQWFDQAYQLARGQKIPQLAAQAKIALAGLLLEEESLDEAVVLARDALMTLQGLPEYQQHLSIQKQAAMAWHTLGLIASRLPPNKLPLIINHQSYQAPKCYSLGAKMLTDIRMGVAFERALVLRDWALYELRKGDPEKGNSLWQRALSAFIRLQRTEEVAWMEKYMAAQANYFKSDDNA